MNDAERALPELVTTYLAALHNLARATLLALENDTPENRRRAWHLAHKYLGNHSWEGTPIDGADGQDLHQL